MQSFEFSQQAEEALRVMEETSDNLFLTGKAGTGKSTLLEQFTKTTKKNVAVLAPTGVAAINVKGQTIHSFFGFRPDVTLEKVMKQKKTSKKIYQKLDAIVIDEISMVRADLLDCVDAFLRTNGKDSLLPFGGIQMIFIGDLYQLPPIVTREEEETFYHFYESPFFFDSFSFQNIQMQIKTIELKKIYRQTDSDFITILNAIRTNTAKQEHINIINTRYNQTFSPESDNLYIYITTTNQLAAKINEQSLEKIKRISILSNGTISGEFDARNLPTDEDLLLKEGAQVMLLSNDPLGRWVNGTIGKVARIDKDDDFSTPEVFIQLENGRTYQVEEYTWKMYRFELNEEKNHIEAKEVGSFTQFPLKLAWAITIHKSQGKTFEKAIIDIGYGTFAHGQLYVALSRCKTLEGIILKQRILQKHIIVDNRVVMFSENFIQE